VGRSLTDADITDSHAASKPCLAAAGPEALHETRRKLQHEANPSAAATTPPHTLDPSLAIRDVPAVVEHTS